MLQIIVCNRRQVKAMEGDRDTAIISFFTPTTMGALQSTAGYGTPALKEGWGAMIGVSCSDCVPEELESNPTLVLFTESQAFQIIEFVEGNKEKQFLIHCDAGISRSVACGLFVSYWLDRPLKILSTWDDKAANIHVRRTLENAWKRRDIRRRVVLPAIDSTLEDEVDRSYIENHKLNIHTLLPTNEHDEAVVDELFANAPSIDPAIPELTGSSDPAFDKLCLAALNKRLGESE